MASELSLRNFAVEVVYKEIISEIDFIFCKKDIQKIISEYDVSITYFLVEFCIISSFGVQ